MLNGFFIILDQDPTAARGPIAPRNAAGRRTVWPQNAIPILGQFRPRMPSPQDETARRQDFLPPNCYQLMTAAILASPLAPPVAAVARRATAPAARRPRRRPRAAARPRSPPPAALARPSCALPGAR